MVAEHPTLPVLQAALERPLFEDKSWRLSPNPWPLPAEVVSELHAIGDACLGFHKALERLYLKSRSNDRLVRNDDLRAPWVAEYLDAGKPTWLVEHGAAKAVKGSCPSVLRPDLIATADGFALTEMDAVPGGIGLTSFLEEVYLREQAHDVPNAFFQTVSSMAGDCEDMAIVLAVSEESETYRPEMEWIAETLRARGLEVRVSRPEDLQVSSDGVYLEGKRQHVVYRFWELFDDQVPIMRELAEAVESGVVSVTPPMRTFQEEKLSLALFWHHRLGQFWEENLSPTDLNLLRKIIPPTWILDPAELPPGAMLAGPTVGGSPISSWHDLAKASKKERELVVKASGFHETAWGSRSVVIGSDASGEEWTGAIENALASFPEPIHVLQEFRKPALLTHDVFEDSGEITPMKGRLRLSPYYFVRDGKAGLSAALATFCPADKKIIHGMRDGVLLPCVF